jgi:hypothetical protein
MTEKELLIQQLESSYQFLHDLWLKTKDPKETEQLKKEMLDCQQQLRWAKEKK